MRVCRLGNVVLYTVYEEPVHSGLHYIIALQQWVYLYRSELIRQLNYISRLGVRYLLTLVQLYYREAYVRYLFGMYLRGVYAYQSASARRTLRSWIAKNTALQNELARTGYSDKAILLTPAQVGLIFRFLGEP